MTTSRVLDARPILPISENSLWDHAAQKRDEIALEIGNVLHKRGILGWVRKSKPGEYPLYVAVDSWRPISQSSASQTTDRSNLRIEINVEPFKQHPLIYKVSLNRQSKSFSSEYWELYPGELVEMIGYLIEGGPKPKFFKSRQNRLIRILGAFIPPLRLLDPTSKNKLIEEARPNYFAFSYVLGWIGIICAFAGYTGISAINSYNSPSELYGFLIGFGGILMVIAFVIRKKRPIYHAIAKQSQRSPRQEFLVDSWHVSVPGASSEFAAFRHRIIQALAMIDPSIELNGEIHQSATPRGFEERERLVLTKNQGNVHVHIYPYSNDVFVGWDGYLNWARWSESKPVSTTVRDGKTVVYKSLETGFYYPSEFDLMELNALSDMVHRTLKKEIRAFLREKQIEADLDFEIIRGDRANVLKAGKDLEKKGRKSKTKKQK